MNKKKIDALVLASYENNFLNRKNVNRIAILLNKSDFKKYINGLKLQEKKRTVTILSPVNNQYLNKFQKLFPNKRIILKNDSSLMLGVKIVENDTVYEFTLKNFLDKIISHVKQSYD